jgi:hypothetical protein
MRPRHERVHVWSRTRNQRFQQISGQLSEPVRDERQDKDLRTAQRERRDQSER